MSYKVLSFHTRNEIVQFCQQTTFLTQHQPLPLSCSRLKHLHRRTSTVEPENHKTSRINLCFGYKLQDHLAQQLQNHSKRGVMELQGLLQLSVWFVAQEGKAARVQTPPQVGQGGIIWYYFSEMPHQVDGSAAPLANTAGRKTALTCHQVSQAP